VLLNLAGVEGRHQPRRALGGGQDRRTGHRLGGWQAEWETLPELITLVGGALAQSEALVRDMQVFPQKMLTAQRLNMMMRIGFADEFRQRQGHRLSHNQPVGNRLCPLVDLLAADPQVSQYLSRECLTTLLDPATATGWCPASWRER
jgi:3-carboxy-cis,cis-muconate cycloisomerase